MKNFKRRSLLGLLAIGTALFNGCGALYTNTREPYSYRAETPIDVKASPSDPVVHGRACEYYVLWFFNWGNCGYAATVKSAVKDSSHAMLYDSKFDQTLQSWLLGLYIKQCTVVTGRVGPI